MNWLIVPKVKELNRDILEESHRSRLTIHPRGTKMYTEKLQICVQVPYLPVGKSRTPQAWMTFATVASSGVEVGAHHNGLRGGISSILIEP